MQIRPDFVEELGLPYRRGRLGIFHLRSLDLTMLAGRSLYSRLMLFGRTYQRLLIGLGILLLSSLIYLPNLNNPPYPYWDEYYYISAVERHAAGTATYISHPPLGPMLLSLGPALVGDNRSVDMREMVGLEKLTDNDIPADYRFFGIRLPSSISAVLGALLFYAILLRLGLSGYAAFAFSTLYIFENAFVIHFRAVHLDSFQISFFLAALLVWLRKPQHSLSWKDYALFSFFIGLSFMVKTNVAVMLIIPASAMLCDLWSRRHESRAYRWAAANATATASAFIAAILLVFTINFAVSPRAPDPQTDAGRHDLQQMGPAYQAYLEGRTGFTFAALEQSMLGYAKRMRNDFEGVGLGDPNGQAPLTWPFYTKPISYRWDSDGTFTYYSSLVGNPVGWRLSFVGILIGTLLIVLRWRRSVASLCSPEFKTDFAKLETVIMAYAVFLAVHAYLGLLRVMYPYHHFPGLVLGFVALALSFKIAIAAFPSMAKRENVIAAALSMAVALGFWFYSPFSYHRGLTKADCELRNHPMVIATCVGT